MKVPVIWFNRGLSQTGFLIKALKSALKPGEQLRIVASHQKAEVPAALAADHFELEPSGLENSQAYVDWALNFVRRHSVNVLFAHAHSVALSAARQRFADAGCQLITAGGAETIKLLKSKTALYNVVRQAGGLGIAIPECLVATDRQSLLAALEALRARHKTVCFKPSIDIGGHGFRIVTDLGARYPQPYNGDALPMTLDEARAYLASYPEPFPEMMAMPYLNGPEYSLDCLAQKGRLIAAVARSKSQGGLDELITEEPDLEEQARALTSLLQLDGLYNVQFLESETGERYLLEINPRMAGGIYWGAFAGVLLPYWAIRLSLGTASEADIPRVTNTVRVDRKTQTIIA
ncbi:MAG TPA: ATP-grasp domain-containing protein [Candidatus Obscuribacterales bacterium]